MFGKVMAALWNRKKKASTLLLRSTLCSNGHEDQWKGDIIKKGGGTTIQHKVDRPLSILPVGVAAKSKCRCHSCISLFVDAAGRGASAWRCSFDFVFLFGLKTFRTFMILCLYFWVAGCLLGDFRGSLKNFLWRLFLASYNFFPRSWTNYTQAVFVSVACGASLFLE